MAIVVESQETGRGSDGIGGVGFDFELAGFTDESLIGSKCDDIGGLPEVSLIGEDFDTAFEDDGDFGGGRAEVNCCDGKVVV